MNMYYADPNNFEGRTDSEKIQFAIKSAKETGTNKVVIPPYNKTRNKNEWVVEETILLPSDITIVLDNCYIRMGDDTFCNMFRNENAGTEKAKTMAGRQENICFEGVGSPVLDGGKYNGLCEANSEKDGRPHITVNNMIFMANVKNFKMKNFKVKNQRWWALNFYYCTEGYIGNIEIDADMTWVDAEGNRVGMPPKGLEYAGIYIKNADGIDIRSGCHNIIIENITGYTEDDTVALTGLRGKGEARNFVEDAIDSDIHNIIIRNVMSSTICANVRMLNQSGVKLYNILVDGVYDAAVTADRYAPIHSSDLAKADASVVRIGDTRLYGTRQSTPDETYNITVRNVVSQRRTAVSVAGGVKDSVVENIRTFCEYEGIQKLNYSTADMVNCNFEE